MTRRFILAVVVFSSMAGCRRPSYFDVEAELLKDRCPKSEDIEKISHFSESEKAAIAVLAEQHMKGPELKNRICTLQILAKAGQGSRPFANDIIAGLRDSNRDVVAAAGLALVEDDPHAHWPEAHALVSNIAGDLMDGKMPPFFSTYIHEAIVEHLRVELGKKPSRMAAIKALAVLGKEAASSLPDLFELLSDPETVDAAAEAIVRIDSSASAGLLSRMKALNISPQHQRAWQAGHQNDIQVFFGSGHNLSGDSYAPIVRALGKPKSIKVSPVEGPNGKYESRTIVYQGLQLSFLDAGLIGVEITTNDQKMQSGIAIGKTTREEVWQRFGPPNPDEEVIASYSESEVGGDKWNYLIGGEGTSHVQFQFNERDRLKRVAWDYYVDW